MKIIYLLIALTFWCTTCRGEVSNTQLLKSFAFVESSNRPQILGDSGKAWGLFQFHKARYLELGGNNWGSANVFEQQRVMLKEISIVRAKNKSDLIQALATYHNLGHIEYRETD